MNPFIHDLYIDWKYIVGMKLDNFLLKKNNKIILLVFISILLVFTEYFKNNEINMIYRSGKSGIVIMRNAI